MKRITFCLSALVCALMVVSCGNPAGSGAGNTGSSGSGSSTGLGPRYEWVIEPSIYGSEGYRGQAYDYYNSFMDFKIHSATVNNAKKEYIGRVRNGNIWEAVINSFVKNGESWYCSESYISYYLCTNFFVKLIYRTYDVNGQLLTESVQFDYTTWTSQSQGIEDGVETVKLTNPSDSSRYVIYKVKDNVCIYVAEYVNNLLQGEYSYGIPDCLKDYTQFFMGNSLECKRYSSEGLSYHTTTTASIISRTDNQIVARIVTRNELSGTTSSEQTVTYNRRVVPFTN